MSFDIFLQKFTDGRDAHADRDRVRRVLSSKDFNGPDQFGFYLVRFPDGTDVEFSAKGLDGEGDFAGCAFHIRGLSSNLIEFVWEIAKEGDMVILPAMQDFVPILSSPRQWEHLPSNLIDQLADPVVCESSIELQCLLIKGHSGWREYRNQLNEDRT